jgi:hypothetical protein
MSERKAVYRVKIQTAASPLEASLLLDIRAAGLPEPAREYRFHPVRKWRFDLAYPDLLIAVECEGGTYSGGRHVKPQGFEGDCEKYDEAELMGWMVLRFTGNMIHDGRAIRYIQRAVKNAQRGMI